MRLMGLEAIYQAPKTSVPHPAHRIYPYLLKRMKTDRPNQVWCADITYIPVQRGLLRKMGNVNFHQDSKELIGYLSTVDISEKNVSFIKGNITPIHLL